MLLNCSLRHRVSLSHKVQTCSHAEEGAFTMHTNFVYVSRTKHPYSTQHEPPSSHTPFFGYLWPPERFVHGENTAQKAYLLIYMVN